VKRGLKLGFGIALCVVGFFTTIFGVAILAVVGPDGRFSIETSASSNTRALVFDAISIRDDLPASGRLSTTLDLEIRSPDRPAFIGVGPTPEVAMYLDEVAVDHVIQVNWPGGVRTEEVPGSREPPPPADEPFWIASDQGTVASIDWTVRGGNWTIVIMNADAARGVDVAGSVAVTLPILGPAGIGLLAIGLIMVVVGVLLTISGSKTPKEPATSVASSVGAGMDPPPPRPDPN
jgi:hypothetical protein